MNAPQGKFPDESPDPGRWLDDHGNYLFKYAVFRLRDNNAAEDAVQETFLAALKAYKQFEGRGSERTWLVGILKHKIVDHFRRVGNTIAAYDKIYFAAQRIHLVQDQPRESADLIFKNSQPQKAQKSITRTQ